MYLPIFFMVRSLARGQSWLPQWQWRNHKWYGEKWPAPIHKKTLRCRSRWLFIVTGCSFLSCRRDNLRHNQSLQNIVTSKCRLVSSLVFNYDILEQRKSHCGEKTISRPHYLNNRWKSTVTIITTPNFDTGDTAGFHKDNLQCYNWR